MNNIIPLEFESHAIRVQVDDGGQPWFNANDVCAAMELANPRDAFAKHVDPEDVAKCDTLTAGGSQPQNYVNESGLYSLIIGSTKESAKRFKRWVTSEVLPSIRRTGTYTSAPSIPPQEIIDPETASLLGNGFGVIKNRIQYHGQDLQKISTEFNACLRAAALAAKHLAITDNDWIVAHAIRNLRHTTGIDMRVLTGARTLTPYLDDLVSPGEIGYELGFIRHPAEIANLLLSEIG